jgi:predicted O-methyltransferase YrrM
MFTTTNESVFFLAEIDKTKKVLEYGSGQSTFEIADKCLNIISIEHQEDWYNKLQDGLLSNCEIILKKPDLPYVEGGHCGTYEEFKSYIEAPLDKGPFDVILIDGRARVSCASVVKLMSHDNTIIFIHDFNRPEYQDALNFLELVEQVGTMAKFKLKK